MSVWIFALTPGFIVVPRLSRCRHIFLFLHFFPIYLRCISPFANTMPMNASTMLPSESVHHKIFWQFNPHNTTWITWNMWISIHFHIPYMDPRRITWISVDPCYVVRHRVFGKPWKPLETLGTIQFSTGFHDLRCGFPCGFFTKKNS